MAQDKPRAEVYYKWLQARLQEAPLQRPSGAARPWLLSSSLGVSDLAHFPSSIPSMTKLGSQPAEAVNSTCAVQFLSLPGHMKIFPSSPEVECDHANNSTQLAESRNDVCTCVHAKSFQLCPTLCDPVDYSRPGSSVHGIL